MLVARKNVMMI